MNDPFSGMFYRLSRLEFQNGALVSFSDARMIYNPAERCVGITNLGMTARALETFFTKIAGPHDSAAVKIIFYEMVVPGYSDLRFFHLIQRGADFDLKLFPPSSTGPRLRLVQLDGRPIFSKNFTLRSVSNGRIPSQKAVWQFHGYKHEH